MAEHASRSSRRWRKPLMASVVLLLVGGCQPAPAPPSEPVTIRLVNQTSFVLDPNLYAAAGASTEAALFTGPNLVTSFSDAALATVPANESRTVVLECDAARTIGVRNPVFTDPVGFSGGGTADLTLFLQEGADYTCGNTVVFTYTSDGETFTVTVGFQ